MQGCSIRSRRHPSFETGGVIIAVTVAVGQLYRDLASDMKARDRRLRVLALDAGRAELVVEGDLYGQVGKKTHASLSRLQSSAFELLEDPSDTDPLYLSLLAAMAEVSQRREAAPADYARAALQVLGEMAPKTPGEERLGD